jgi:DNA-binding MarR family transcriptional regulator
MGYAVTAQTLRAENGKFSGTGVSASTTDPGAFSGRSTTPNPDGWPSPAFPAAGRRRLTPRQREIIALAVAQENAAKYKLQLQLGFDRFSGVRPKLDEITITAWACLVRTQQVLLERVEADLKQAGLPPLRWYDVLLELHRAGSKGLRQFEIGSAVLLSKYNVSRLLDRLEKEKLLERYVCEEDGRGARVQVTAAGRDLAKRMWPVYGAAIIKHFAQYFSKTELKQLATLLGRLPGVAR